MRKSKIVLMAVYSLFIAVFLLGNMFFFQQKIQTPQSASSLLIYKTDHADFENNYHGGTITIQLSDINSGQHIMNEYQENVMEQIASFTAICFLVLVISTVIFFILEYNLQKRYTKKILYQLDNEITDEVIQKQDPLFRATFRAVREHFDNHLNSYKRLHSYLSHEQKNQIAVLKSNLEQDGKADDLKVLDKIVDSIDDVLTLSENKDTSSLCEVDVALVCAEVCDIYGHLANITFDFSEENNAIISAKERWIYRAVSNLVDNAIKYSNGGNVTVKVYCKYKSVVIAVEDNGIGISAEQLDRIFQHHYQIDELNQDGYGIGLSLVSHVCDLCDGFVFAESILGVGSKFYMSFPERDSGLTFN